MITHIPVPAMERAVASPNIFRFGLFEADAANGTLMRNGVRVKIQDQPFRVLVFLLERAGEIVTREELRQRLWPEGTYVDFDGSLNVILKKLRAAIDDDSENPRLVRTNPFQLRRRSEWHGEIMLAAELKFMSRVRTARPRTGARRACPCWRPRSRD